MIAQAFNTSTWKEKQADPCKFEANLVYIGSSRTAMTS